MNKLNAQVPVFPGCGPDSSEVLHSLDPKSPKFNIGTRSFYLYDERNRLIEINDISLPTPTSTDYRRGNYRRFYYKDSLLKTTTQINYTNYTDTAYMERKDYEYNSAGVETTSYWYIGDSSFGKWKWILYSKYRKTYNDKHLLTGSNNVEYNLKTRKIIDTSVTTYLYDNQNRLITMLIERKNEKLTHLYNTGNMKLDYFYNGNLLASTNRYDPNERQDGWQKTATGAYFYDSLNRQTKLIFLWLNNYSSWDTAQVNTTAYDAIGSYAFQQKHVYDWFDSYVTKTKYYNSCNHRIGTIPPASPDTVIYKLSCFPNPVSTEINFTVDPTDDEISIKIHSALGKLIYQGTFQPKSYLLHLDVSSYDESIYIYEINSNNRGLLKRDKFIVSH